VAAAGVAVWPISVPGSRPHRLRYGPRHGQGRHGCDRRTRMTRWTHRWFTGHGYSHAERSWPGRQRPGGARRVPEGGAVHAAVRERILTSRSRQLRFQVAPGCRAAGNLRPSRARGATGVQPRGQTPASPSAPVTGLARDLSGHATASLHAVRFRRSRNAIPPVIGSLPCSPVAT
jgi:hypothetical protein